MTTEDAFFAPPLVDGDASARRLDEDVYRPLESFPTFRWWIAFAISGSFALWLLYCVGYTVVFGLGTWGLKRPVYWAFAITNFVFWIGIGHAGTLISAILYLFRQGWRTGIARFSEAMTIFAVICAGIFPLIHTGRPWLAWYWLFPAPNQHHLWINFRSPLCWDFFAVSTTSRPRFSSGTRASFPIWPSRATAPAIPAQTGLWPAEPGMERERARVEPLRKSLSSVRRPFDATGPQRPLHRLV